MSEVKLSREGWWQEEIRKLTENRDQAIKGLDTEQARRELVETWLVEAATLLTQAQADPRNIDAYTLWYERRESVLNFVKGAIGVDPLA